MKTLDKVFINSKNSWRGLKYYIIDDNNKVTTSTKLRLLCSDCNTEIIASAEKIFIGQKPCKCGKNYYKTSERKMEKLCEVLVNKNCERVDAVRITSSEQKLAVKCNTCHNVWMPSYASIANRGLGCPKCAGQYRYSDEEYIEKVNDVGVVNKFKFVRKTSEDKLRIQSKVLLQCAVCYGEWAAALSNTLTGKYSCPSCARRGFNPTKRAVLYLLKILDMSGKVIAYKYGITNVLNKRIANIKTSNSMHEFILCVTWGYEEGMVAKAHERNIKIEFVKHLNKEVLPDGYTETIKPEHVLELFGFQNKQYLSTGVQPGGGTSAGPTN